MEAAKKRINVERAQNFMRQFRNPESGELKKLSANQFMDVWSHYDKDGELILSSLLSLLFLKFSRVFSSMCVT
jgi:hypothetical protein